MHVLVTATELTVQSGACSKIQVSWLLETCRRYRTSKLAQQEQPLLLAYAHMTLSGSLLAEPQDPIPVKIIQGCGLGKALSSDVSNVV